MATDLKGELTCPICMELYNRPLRLPCGHSYCKNCLETFISQQSKKDIVTGQMKPVKCPECRFMLEITIEGADVFPPDFKLTNLVDVYRKIEDAQNQNTYTNPGNSTELVPSEQTSANETAGEVIGACGYTPVFQEITPQDTGATCDSASNDVEDEKRVQTSKKAVCHDSDSETESEKELSDDNSSDGRPRRRKRKNKVIRFFASLLSLSSSSDGEYDLNDATSSSDDVDMSRPVREVKPSVPPKEVPRRRNRWGFFTSSSDSEGEEE